MGKHNGWRVYFDRGAWVGAAWDPTARPKPAYRSQRFGPKGKADATKWAKEQSAAFLTRLDFINREVTKTLVADYVEHLTIVKRRSDSHLANVRRCLNAVAAAAPDINAPSAKQTLTIWLAKLDAAASTKVQYSIIIKAMANWAYRQERMPERARNRILGIETEKPGDFLKEQFTVDELRTIARAIDDPWWWPAVTYAFTGMRAREPMAVMRENIDLSGGVIPVHGKGNKTRLVPIMDEYRYLLEIELSKRRRGPLVEHYGELQSRYFAAFLRRLRITKGKRTLHSFRHSYAGIRTAMDDSSLRLADAMGHASSDTTKGYTKLAERYRDAVKDWPRGQFSLLTGWSSKLTKTVTAV